MNIYLEKCVGITRCAEVLRTLRLAQIGWVRVKGYTFKPTGTSGSRASSTGFSPKLLDFKKASLALSMHDPNASVRMAMSRATKHVGVRTLVFPFVLTKIIQAVWIALAEFLRAR